MTFKKIRGIDKQVCTAEQKIAYNFACRYRDLNNIELYQLAYMVADEIKRSPELAKYDIDSITHCFRNGFINYKNNYPTILTDYETIGKVFYSLYEIK